MIELIEVFIGRNTGDCERWNWGVVGRLEAWVEREGGGGVFRATMFKVLIACLFWIFRDSDGSYTTGSDSPDRRARKSAASPPLIPAVTCHNGRSLWAVISCSDYYCFYYVPLSSLLPPMMILELAVIISQY